MAIRIYSRRNFFKKTIFPALALPAISLGLSACNKNADKPKEDKPAKAVDACEDFSQVTEADLKARQKMGYVKQSPIAESKCKNCQLFLPLKDSPACGKCQLFKGPVLVEAYCTYWAPQMAG
jgi:hypothetical protein